MAKLGMVYGFEFARSFFTPYPHPLVICYIAIEAMTPVEIADLLSKMVDRSI